MDKSKSSIKKLHKDGFLYEPEENVLMYRISSDKIDSAEKDGDIIIHFSKDNKPVLFEIFNAVGFLRKASHQLP